MTRPLALLALVLTSCSRPGGAPVDLIPLEGQGLAAFTSDFNRAKDATRILVLLSPT